MGKRNTQQGRRKKRKKARETYGMPQGKFTNTACLEGKEKVTKVWSDNNTLKGTGKCH